MTKQPWPRATGTYDRKTQTRRAAIGVASALLLLMALFMAGPQHTPGFARELLWGPQEDDITSAEHLATGASASEPEAQHLATATQMPDRFIVFSLLKQPRASATGARLDPLPKWVQVTLPATLWSRSDSQASSLLRVPEKFPLQVLGQAEKSRLPVYYDDGKAGGLKLGGWLDLPGVVPAEEPQRVVASSRGGLRPTPDISTPDMFIAAVAEAAQESQRDSRVPASVTIAQGILESDWGRSLLSKKANNFFGIKATSGPGPAGVISMNTWEVLGGKNVTVKDGFKAYNNLWESVMDHGRFLLNNQRYSAAFKVPNDAQEFARRIHAAGYATDPAYSTKLINLMAKYNLYQYDLKLP